MRFKWSLLMGLVLLSGCVTKRENQPFSAACLKEKKTVVIAQISGFQNTHYLKAGVQGVLDVLINNILGKSIEKKLKTLNSKSLIKSDYYKRFSQYFSRKNINVVQYFKPIETDLFKRDLRNEAKHAPRDLAFLKEKFKADYALVLDPIAFGIIREYYSFVPLGRPQGYISLFVYMIDLSTNHLEGYFESKVFVPVTGNWDADDYSELFEASKTALRRSLLNSYNYLISSDIDEALDEDLTSEDSL